MIISREGHTVGIGSTPEIAVDTLAILETVLTHEVSEEIIDNMIKCDYECNSSVLKDFAKILTERMEEYLKA